MPGMIKGKHLKFWVIHDSKVVYINYLLLLINETEMTNCLAKLFLLFIKKVNEVSLKNCVKANTQKHNM